MTTRDYKDRSNPGAKRRKRGGSSCLFWFVSGAVIGAFGVALAWVLDDSQRPGSTVAQTETTAPSVTSREASDAASEVEAVPDESQTEPRFDFHNILKDLTVDVPAEEPLPTALPKPPADAPVEPPARPKPEPKPAPVARTEPPPAVPSPRPVKPTPPPVKPSPTPQREVVEKPVPAPAPSTPTRYLLQVGSFRDSSDADALKGQLAFLGLQASVRHSVVGGRDYYRVRLGPFNDKAAMERQRSRLIKHGHSSFPIKIE